MWFFFVTQPSALYTHPSIWKQALWLLMPPPPERWPSLPQALPECLTSARLHSQSEWLRPPSQLYYMSTLEFHDRNLIILTPTVNDIECDELGAGAVLLILRRQRTIAAGEGSEEDGAAPAASKEAKRPKLAKYYIRTHRGISDYDAIQRAISVMIYSCGPDLLLWPAVRLRCPHRQLYPHLARVSLRQPACAHRPWHFRK